MRYSTQLNVFVAVAGCGLLFSNGLAEVSNPALQNWPQWRGPLANGVGPQANPAVTWNETSHIKWKVGIPGTGAATPVIWGNKVFIQTAIPTGKKIEPPAAKSDAAAPTAEVPPPNQQGRRRGGGFGGGPKPTEFQQFVILCLNRSTGEVLWQKTAREEVPHEGFKQGDGSFASSSPVTDGKYVFAYFGSRGLHCYDLEGNPRWSKDLGQMRAKMTFGEGSSPALFGNFVVVNWDHEGEDFIVAFDKESGKELWRVPRQEDTSWSTPLIVEYEKKPQVVTAATSKIRSYDLGSGQLIWETAGLTPNAIPSPVATDEIVYAMSGFRGHALLAIRLGGSGDLAGTDRIVWKHGKSTPYVPSPLLYGDKLYFFSDNNGLLSCFDAKSGKPHFETERIDALNGVYASPVGADGRVYLVGRNGASVVIKNSEKFEILATNKLDDKFDASPAMAGKELFLRGQANLYCIAE